MGAVVGIDLSSRALDLVKLDEDSARAEWLRVNLAGANAWERTLGIRAALHPGVWSIGKTPNEPVSAWWDDVYLVAIEAPYGRGRTGTTSILNRVVGAIAASLPATLRAPERCWIVGPHEWKTGLGLKGKPTWKDHERLAGSSKALVAAAGVPLVPLDDEEAWQNARDAYCLAMWARDTNARAVGAA